MLLLAATSAFAAGSYTARRFDVYATVQHGGALDVRETIQFEFQSGTFTRVWREIPTYHTDSIDVLDSSMDGNAIRPDVSRDTHVRVEWTFPSIGPSTHTFILHYIVRGVVFREGDRDVLRWRALPTEHSYAIDASRITIHANEPDADPPGALVHRAVLSYARAIPSGGIDIEAGPIRSNGYVIADVRFGAGRIAAALPQWQQHQDASAALAPRWAMAGGVVLVIGILIVIIARQGYPAPSIRPDETTTTDPPSDVPAAVAAMLVNNGRYPAHAAAATLIDLADRGVLKMREVSRTLGIRHFEVSQTSGAHNLAEHEAAAIVTAFAGGSDPVTLSVARRRLAQRGRSYHAALTTDLIEHGFIDAERSAVRSRAGKIGVGMLFAGFATAIAAGALVPAYGAWTFLVPAGFIVAGLVGTIVAASLTPLTDAALVEAARWRGYRRHLKAVAANPDLQAPQGVPSRWIIYGIALGLAYQWSRYLKKHPQAAPSWCVTLQDDGGAYAALIASHAATGGHGAGPGAGAGAAAGGGSSGAA